MIYRLRPKLFAYLASGFIKGIGEATARLLVDKFGAETLEIIKTEPMKAHKNQRYRAEKSLKMIMNPTRKTAIRDIIMGMQGLGFQLQ